MKFVSKAAMAAALAVGMTAAVSVPPAFAKQDKKEEAPLKVGKEFRVEALAAQKALQANDNATAKAHLEKAAPLAKTDDEKYFLATLSLPLAAREGDQQAMQSALKTLVASPRVSDADKGKYNFYLARIAMNTDKDAQAAQTYLDQAKALGYTDPEMALFEASLAGKNGDPAKALGALDQAISAQVQAGKKPSEDLYKYGVAQAYKSKNDAETMKWLKRWIVAYPSPENWRQVIGVYRQNADKGNLPKADQLDLFRLMRATDSLASERDYFEYANLANNSGLPYEAKTVIDAGRASGKLPADQRSVNEVYSSANASIKQDTSLATLEKQALAASNGKLARQTGDAYLAKDNYAKAIELYKAALSKGGVDNNVVNTRLGIALADSGDLAQAQAAFDAVQATGARADIVGLWETWLKSKTGASASTSAAAPAPAGG
ncbi:hypothetical protein [Stakelama marina]|uniref:Tetratricopeptide repeat protein n=1 Tax=Stakelama marina TaxID=2826939 RepID=A0A8T4IA46_9SPHN|nr:hypothetical protein [Stakelama marina]MBR0551527.1 hypothetical protein [Stakelama marina]